METFPYCSQFVNWQYATSIKICTQQCLPSLATKIALHRYRPPTQWLFKIGKFFDFHSSAIHFRGLSIRQVSCYTILDGFRLPWPPSCCYYRQTPFTLSDSWKLSHISLTSGSTLIASPAYQDKPICRYALPCYINILSLQSLRIGPGQNTSQNPLIIIFTRHNYTARQLSWGKLRGEPATR